MGFFSKPSAMTDHGPRKSADPSRFTRFVNACPICETIDFLPVAEPGESNSAVVACKSCGLFISTPTLPFEALQIFYCEEFDGDAGTATAAKRGKVRKSFDRLLEKTRKRELVIVEKIFGDVRGRTVLDLRSRSGALALLMQEAGATVFASDPILPNVEACEKVGLKAYQIGVFEHSNLSLFAPETFDLITGLTIHVLAHLPEPAKFLQSAFELLKPGGYILLDEKNVLRPARNLSSGIFSSGIGHFYHFTPTTFAALLESVGFVNVVVDQDTKRWSAFRHLTASAQKPANGIALNRPPAKINPDLISKQVYRAQFAAKVRAPWNRFMRAIKQAARKEHHV